MNPASLETTSASGTNSPKAKPAPIISNRIAEAVRSLGPGEFNEQTLRTHIHPLFSRVLKRREIYLSNHSLGRPLDQMADDVREALDAWYAEMDGAWDVWLNEQNTFRNNIACLIGLGRVDAVVPKISAGQGLRAVLNALPMARPRVVATRGEFDSIDFILKTYASRERADVAWIEAKIAPGRAPFIDATAVLEAIVKASPAPDLVVVSQFYYATGQRLDRLPEIIAAARSRGALVVLDAFHGAGVVEVDFDGLGPDFAIGGSYKYTRGGPGAAWLAINPRHLTAQVSDSNPRLRTLDTGWFAKRDTFGFQRPDEPQLASGGNAWLEATPAPLPLFQARSGLQLVLALGVPRLRRYSLHQLEQLQGLLSERRVPVYRGGLTPEQSGAFLLVPHRDAPGACDALKREGVNVDARLGHLRFCPDILTSDDEMMRAAEITSRVCRQ